MGVANSQRDLCSSELDSDSHSVDSFASRCSRRSDCIAQKSATSVHSGLPSKKGRYVCDVTDCGSQHDTAGGLAIHKAKRHTGTHTMHNLNANTTDDSWCKSPLRNTRKWHAKDSFSGGIAQFENEFFHQYKLTSRMILHRS